MSWKKSSIASAASSSMQRRTNHRISTARATSRTSSSPSSARDGGKRLCGRIRAGRCSIISRKSGRTSSRGCRLKRPTACSKSAAAAEPSRGRSAAEPGTSMLSRSRRAVRKSQRGGTRTARTFGSASATSTTSRSGHRMTSSRSSACSSMPSRSRIRRRRSMISSCSASSI